MAGRVPSNWRLLKRVGPARGTEYYAVLAAGTERIRTRTSDPNEAMRFSRKQDAIALIRMLDTNDFGPVGAIATEHQWLSLTPSPDGEGS